MRGVDFADKDLFVRYNYMFSLGVENMWQDCFSWFEAITGSSEREFLQQREKYIRRVNQTSPDLVVENCKTGEVFQAGHFDYGSATDDDEYGTKRHG